MNAPGNNPTREERLAAKLRENLRRRKAQARAMSGSEKASRENSDPAKHLPKKQPDS
jgi:hypothetical protein